MGAEENVDMEEEPNVKMEAQSNVKMGASKSLEMGASKNINKMQPEDAGVLMFGMMGVGKSTFANTLLGRKEFIEGEGAESVT